MANHTHNDGKVLGRDSEGWNTLRYLAMFGMAAAGFLTIWLPGSVIVLLLAMAATGLLAVSVGGQILALVREGHVEKERKGRKELQKLLASPNSSSKLTADPALYRRARAELQARKEDALKMQRLHALRRQVEEEERKAGIFVPTLSSTRPLSNSKHPQQADPMAAQMVQLTRRRTEAERQKHLMKSLRAVEDSEWEADDV